MNGMVKLKIVVLILLLLQGCSILIAFTLPDQTSEYQEAYDSLTTSEQSAVDKFLERIPEEQTGTLMVIGYMQIAVGIGLFILMVRLWNMKKI